jgi:hypothetical protein
MKQGKLMVEVFKQEMNKGIPEMKLSNLDEIFVHENVVSLVSKCSVVSEMQIEAKFGVDVCDRDGKTLVKNGIQIRILMKNKKFDCTKAPSKDNKKFFCIGFGGLRFNPNDFVNATLWDGRVVRVSYIPD